MNRIKAVLVGWLASEKSEEDTPVSPGYRIQQIHSDLSVPEYLRSNYSVYLPLRSDGAHLATSTIDRRVALRACWLDLASRVLAEEDLDDVRSSLGAVPEDECG